MIFESLPKLDYIVVYVPDPSVALYMKINY
jgi:hypothetical protein